MQKDPAILIKSFAEILENDIKKIRKVIEEKYLETFNNLRSENELERTSSIDFNVFKALVNEICFDNLSHTEQRPFSQMPNSKPSRYEEIVYDVPEKRLMMFNDLFDITECKITIPSEINNLTAVLIDPQKLYYLFFFHLFHCIVGSKKDLEQLLDKMVTEWGTALKTKKIPIKLNIFLDRILIERTLKKQSFQLKHLWHTEVTRLSPYKANIHIPQFLVFKSEIPLFLYEMDKEYDTTKDDYTLFIQMQNIFDKFKEFMCALYFHDYYLPNPNPIIKLPWWIEPECRYLQRFYKKTENNFIYKEARKLTEANFEAVLETYSLLKGKGFYDRSCFPLLFSVKNLAFSEPFRFERVFYSHTLLEFLFSPHPPIDLSFKVSLDASLQISEDYNQFYENFVLFRKMYNLRSKAIHGEDWAEIINKTISKLNEIGFGIRNISELFEKFNMVILKILNCLVKVKFAKIKSSVVESLANGDLLSFQKKKYENLIQLGEFYIGTENYVLSLKIFYEAYTVAQKLSDNNKIAESSEKIKQLYSSNDNIVAYPNEFNLVLEELSMISKFNINKQTIAKEIHERFSALKKKTEYLPINNSFKLKINGNIIMNELNLKEGPVLGKILSFIEGKIRSGELQNEEEILRSYLKTIDLSSLK